jgi:hypothetical protein
MAGVRRASAIGSIAAFTLASSSFATIAFTVTDFEFGIPYLRGSHQGIFTLTIKATTLLGLVVLKAMTVGQPQVTQEQHTR